MTAQERELGERWVEHVVEPDEAGHMVREILARRLRLSKQMIRRLLQTEGLRLNGMAPYLTNRVRAGDVVSIRLSGTEAGDLRPVAMELVVVYEDADLLVIDKPAGLLVHPTRRSHVHTLAHGIAHRYALKGVRAKVHPVHRLDRDTSGLVLIAKHPIAHQRLDRQLRTRMLRRRYLALVAGVVQADEGTVDAAIGKHPTDAHLRAVAGEVGAPALTRYRVVERFPGGTLLELELETGRTHQIRVHMAHLGHPLFGDRQYGGPALRSLARQALHAHSLAFAHPLTREELAFRSPLPADLARACEEVRAGSGRRES